MARPRGSWHRLVLGVVLALAACDGGGRSGAGGVSGPEGGVLEFDAAMLGGASDAGPVDAGRLDAGWRDATTRRDSGPRDAGLPDAGRPDGGARCTGTPTPCSLLSTSTCLETEGCRLGGDCRGSARSCYYLNRYECIDQDGCYWSSSRDDCSGSSRSCRYYTSSYGCIRQDGCYWTDDCEGTAIGCGAFLTHECTSQPGCRLEWD